MKFCPEKDIYAVVDGDEEDEAETVGFAPRCAVTTICPGRLGGVGLGVGETVVQPDTTPITAKHMLSAEIAPLPIPTRALQLFVLYLCQFGLLITHLSSVQ
jgi:hypothetical protein